jgi:hypothetical protein
MPDFLLFDFLIFLILIFFLSTEDEESVSLSQTLLVNSESLSDKTYFFDLPFLRNLRFEILKVICRWRIGNYFFTKYRRQREES